VGTMTCRVTDDGLAKAAEDERSAKELARVRLLAGMLFAATPKLFTEALDKDKAQRRAKRQSGLCLTASGGRATWATSAPACRLRSRR
jgi:hypothetical protein